MQMQEIKQKFKFMVKVHGGIETFKQALQVRYVQVMKVIQ